MERTGRRATARPASPSKTTEASMSKQRPADGPRPKTWVPLTLTGLLAVSLVTLALGLQAPAANAAPLSWTAPMPIDPQVDSQTAVSCPTVGLCVVVDGSDIVT